MNFEKLPPYCYLDKNYRVVLYEPEKKVELEGFNEKLWGKKFPQDIKKSIALDKLLLTNIGIYSIATPQISQSLIDFIYALCDQYKLKRDTLRITETNGGLGGFSIRLAHYFNTLNIVEINPQHADIIENNLHVYELNTPDKKIKIYKENYLNIMHSITSDVIICDPPWGGYNYAKQKSIRLGFDNINVTCIINELIKNKLFKLFILMTPRNYDIHNFISNINSKNIVIHKLEKHYFIAIINIL